MNGNTPMRTLAIIISWVSIYLSGIFYNRRSISYQAWPYACIFKVLFCRILVYGVFILDRARGIQRLDGSVQYPNVWRTYRYVMCNLCLSPLLGFMSRYQSVTKFEKKILWNTLLHHSRSMHVFSQHVGDCMVPLRSTKSVRALSFPVCRDSAQHVLSIAVRLPSIISVPY